MKDNQKVQNSQEPKAASPIPPTPNQRARRKVAREVAQLYDDIARAAGFTPTERQTAWAIVVKGEAG